jgi:hypothetical protein
MSRAGYYAVLARDVTGKGRLHTAHTLAEAERRAAEMMASLDGRDPASRVSVLWNHAAVRIWVGSSDGWRQL